MTIKIIGIVPDHIKTIVCRNCSFKLEYTENDVEIGYDYCYDGSSDAYDYIVCPNCTKNVVIE